MTESRSRNLSYDIFKGIACIAVVFMHIEFPGTVGVVMQCVTRWSVPFFFAIAGFFFRTETVQECVRKGKHIAKLALYGTLLYVVVNTLQHLAIGDLQAFIKEEIMIANFIAWFVFNNTFYITGILWFLFSLLYVYIAYGLMIRLRLTRFNRTLCIVLFILHFLLGYGAQLAGLPVLKTLYRNWLMEGLPCFLLGKEVSRYLSADSVGSDARKRFPAAIAMLVVGGLILSVVERWLLGRDYSVHIGSIAVVIGLLLFGAVFQMPVNRLTNAFAKLGREYSLVVYIIHMAVYRAISGVNGLFNSSSNTLWRWTAPIWTAVVSILIAALIDKVKSKRTKEAVG